MVYGENNQWWWEKKYRNFLAHASHAKPNADAYKAEP